MLVLELGVEGSRIVITFFVSCTHARSEPSHSSHSGEFGFKPTMSSRVPFPNCAIPSLNVVHPVGNP